MSFNRQPCPLHEQQTKELSRATTRKKEVWMSPERDTHRNELIPIAVAALLLLVHEVEGQTGQLTVLARHQLLSL